MAKLKITVERVDGYCNQPMLVGDHFFVEGGRITIPEGKWVCMWALQAMMPIFPLQQNTSATRGDWASKKNLVFHCPDPHGQVHYRIERMEEPC